MTLTADDCRETAFGSIRSDAGKFAIRPIEAPAHSIYRVAQLTNVRSACAPLDISPEPLLEISDVPGDSTSDRRVELGTARLDEIAAVLPYLVGEDRNHDLADFLDTAGSVELVPGAAASFDLRDGRWHIEASGDLRWTGCVAGEPGSRLTIRIDGHDKQIDLKLNRGDEVISLRSTDTGYEITATSLHSDRRFVD